MSDEVITAMVKDWAPPEADPADRAGLDNLEGLKDLKDLKDLEDSDRLDTDPDANAVPGGDA